ncbi:MAG: hypothetical protein AAGG48_27970 [Planctomycetota bacterium]
MTGKGDAIEITQSMIRSEDQFYKLMAVKVGGELDPVIVNRFMDSLAIRRPAPSSAGNLGQARSTSGGASGSGIDLHELSKKVGGAGAMLGIGLIVYLISRGKKQRRA